MINIYDIRYGVEDNCVTPLNHVLMGSINDYDTLEEMEEAILDDYDLWEVLELDKKYYIIKENPFKIVGVLMLCKGYTFIDVAEHDDRCVIKTAFPNEICHIVGE